MSEKPSVALLHWGHVIEDYLDAIGISFESFRDEITGGWMFGYIDALGLAGVRTALICISSRHRPGRYRHRPTGAVMWVLPVTRSYRALRALMTDPYSWELEEKHGLPRHLRMAVRDVAPYLPTPLGRLARTLRKEGCAAVLCQEYEYPRFDVCVALGKALRVPVFATFQGGDYHTSRWEAKLRPRTLRHCAGLVVPTATEASRVKERYGVPGEKIARIFNPLDLVRWRPMERGAARAALGLPQEAQVVVWHGRVDMHRKGLDVLLDAWHHLRIERAERETHLLLVGNGPSADELATRLAEPGSGNVHWVAEYVRDRDAMRRYLAAGDVYAFPSRHEGFRRADADARAAGLSRASHSRRSVSSFGLSWRSRAEQ